MSAFEGDAANKTALSVTHAINFTATAVKVSRRHQQQTSTLSFAAAAAGGGGTGILLFLYFKYSELADLILFFRCRSTKVRIDTAVKGGPINGTVFVSL